MLQSRENNNKAAADSVITNNFLIPDNDDGGASKKSEEEIHLKSIWDELQVGYNGFLTLEELVKVRLYHLYVCYYL